MAAALRDSCHVLPFHSSFQPRRNQKRGRNYTPRSWLKCLQLREVKTCAQECSAQFLIPLAWGSSDWSKFTTREVMALWPDKAGLRASTQGANPAQLMAQPAWAAVTKHCTLGAQASRTYSTRLCRLGAEREMPTGSGLVRTHSLAFRLLAVASDHASLPLFIRTLIPYWGAHPHDPI